jgi:hypothetical protein
MSDQSNNIIEINTNISSNITLYQKYTYVIVGEVHVLEDVTVIMEDNVLIMIRNGIFPKSTINRSALIFDTGSKLFASDFYVVPCNKKNNKVTIQNNGGIWFVGSSSNANKDGICAKYSTKSSYFSANKIYTYYLGSKDPVVQVDNGVGPSADQDAITALGCNQNEWNILSVYSENSGDNAFDVVESFITLNEIEVLYPGEDALNIQSGQVNVIKNLILLVPLTDVYDRDIFDFEADNGFSFLRIAQYCNVLITGIFGDQLDLVSSDLPQPTDKVYYFKGVTVNGQSYIYSGLRNNNN